MDIWADFLIPIAHANVYGYAIKSSIKLTFWENLIMTSHPHSEWDTWWNFSKSLTKFIKKVSSIVILHTNSWVVRNFTRTHVKLDRIVVKFLSDARHFSKVSSRVILHMANSEAGWLSRFFFSSGPQSGTHNAHSSKVETNATAVLARIDAVMSKLARPRVLGTPSVAGVSVCVCERERERERGCVCDRERVCVCVYEWARKSMVEFRQPVMCVWETETYTYICVYRGKETESALVRAHGCSLARLREHVGLFCRISSLL